MTNSLFSYFWRITVGKNLFHVGFNRRHIELVDGLQIEGKRRQKGPEKGEEGTRRKITTRGKREEDKGQAGRVRYSVMGRGVTRSGKRPEARGKGSGAQSTIAGEDKYPFSLNCSQSTLHSVFLIHETFRCFTKCFAI